MGSLKNLLNSVFFNTLGDIDLHFIHWDKQSIHIQVTESDKFELQVCTHNVDWFKPAQRNQCCGNITSYLLSYCHDFSHDISPEIPHTAYINISETDCGQISECWNDGCRAKYLYSRRASMKSIEPLEHLSWVILLLLYDFSFDDTLVVARSAMNVSRETWPIDIQCFPSVNNQNANTPQHFLPVDYQKFRLYPVVDSYEVIETLTVTHDIKTAQLRIKDPQCIKLESQIEQVSSLARKNKLQLFINDHWRAAIKYQSYGVHIGQEDLEIANLDQIRNAKLRLGISTHGYYEILKAEAVTPSYIALGHIFPTTTKDMPSKPQGIIRLALYQQLINSMESLGVFIPTVAIGGIDLINAEDVLATGVDSLAVVRAITQSQNVAHTIDKFRMLIDSTNALECVE